MSELTTKNLNVQNEANQSENHASMSNADQGIYQDQQRAKFFRRVTRDGRYHAITPNGNLSLSIEKSLDGQYYYLICKIDLKQLAYTYGLDGKFKGLSKLYSSPNILFEDKYNVKHVDQLLALTMEESPTKTHTSSRLIELPTVKPEVCTLTEQQLNALNSESPLSSHNRLVILELLANTQGVSDELQMKFSLDSPSTPENGHFKLDVDTTDDKIYASYTYDTSGNLTTYTGKSLTGDHLFDGDL